VESLGKIIPWMFALDHYHYARRMTVHVKDLLALPATCPSVQDEFVAGHFVTQKSHHKFSALAHDQIHEQLNAMVKCDGGVVGITENEAALKHWMVAGPEMDRLLTQYEDKHTTQKKVNPRHQRHHEQIPSIQKTFFTNVEGVVTAMEEMGTPFSDASDDLYALDTKVEMPAPVVESIKTAEALGKRQYQRFVDERLNDNVRTFYDTIQKNKLPLFASFDATPKTTNKTAACTSGLKTDIHLFSRMYISCQARPLASNSIMHQTTKSDLVQYLESLVPPNLGVPKVDVRIVDGAALVHSLDPKKSNATMKTVNDYSQHMFLPYLEHMLRDVLRIDVVWDVYRKDSLKAQTRQSSGSGNKL